MSTADFTDKNGKQVNRLDACKQVLDDFLTKRKGDRVGLVFFGTAAFVQAPFTEDLELCRTLLNEAQVGMAGPQTVIGDAVGLSLKVFERSEQEDRVLIVLTDGNDTGSKVTPEAAARIGADKGVTIHTIAVGDPTAVGEEEIDEEVLKEMARVTGGGFYRASDRDQLDGIYQTLDEIETRELETESYQPKNDLFFWPLSGFLLLGLSYHGYNSISQAVQASKKVRLIFPATLLVVGVALAYVLIEAMGRDSYNGFHLLRPQWLLALIPSTLIIRSIVNRSDVGRGLQKVIAPHLLQHLVVEPAARTRFQPLHLLGIAWLLAIVGLAGPTWHREPSPFADDQAAIVFVQEVSPTMLAKDIQPSRLERSVHKIGDLLELRSGTDAALIAYSGSAHLVMPLTNDAEIVKYFAGELSPTIMPVEGDAAASAVELAGQILQQAGRTGSIVLITDGVSKSQNPELAKLQDFSVHLLAIAGEQNRPLPLDSPPAPPINKVALQETAAAANATLTLVTADERDVELLSRAITSSFVVALNEENLESRWRDMGYWLTPLVVLINLFWFRRGWRVHA